MDADASRPLADRMRPRRLEEVCGQRHLLGAGKPLRHALTGGRLHSMIFWGPPGSGKTTLARLVASTVDVQFLSLSAVLAGVKDIRAAIEQARAARAASRQGTVLFIDEVHRFNKAQQDAFLPHVEDGTVVFIGATTENPSFEVNNALLSRARVYVLHTLSVAELRTVIEAALDDVERGLGGQGVHIDVDALEALAEGADGDARRALTFLEIAAELAGAESAGRIGLAQIAAVLSGGSARRFDKGGDAFYDLISALHKALRGSDADASLYWLARLLDGGCDPHYVARRLLRVASEDVGNADPRALAICLDAWQALQRLGSPEGELALAQATVYLACAAKSNAVYTAFAAAMADARTGGSLPVPVHLRNAPTRLMKELGHGRAYRYAHDEPEGYAAGENYFPEGLGPEEGDRRRYYAPPARGLEIRIGEKLEHLRELDRQHLAGRRRRPGGAPDADPDNRP